MKDNLPKKTSVNDLRAKAHKHLEEAERAIQHYSSDTPKMIDYYYDMLERRESNKQIPYDTKDRMIKLLEELGELTQAVAKYANFSETYSNKQKEKRLENIVQEMAQVQLLMEDVQDRLAIFYLVQTALKVEVDRNNRRFGLTFK